MGQSSSRKPLRVFISYAAKDADWKAERVEDVASALKAAGLEVWLDLWYSRQIQAGQTIHAWRMWINEAILGADYVVCLASPRYRALWGPGFERKPTSQQKVQGKILIAEESMRRLQEVFNGRRRNPSYICTLRLSDRDEEVIPKVLFPGFPAYRWASDREEFVSHFGAASGGTSTIGRAIAHSASDVAKAAAEIAAALAGEASTKLAPELAAPMEPSIGVASVAEMQPQKRPSVQSRKVCIPPFGGCSIWPAEDGWRAPIGDFPPPWASAWGDDPYGLWADLTVNGATQRMRWIEPSGPEGFLMGSPQAERDAIEHKQTREWANKSEHPPRREIVKHGFWLADTPCTQAFWQGLTGKNPSNFKKGNEAPERPVENVSWNTVMEQFIARLAQISDMMLAGLPYLPSEVEWEYAARAGTHTAYWWGDLWHISRGNADATGQRRWDGAQGTSPVKRYAPNPWGLFDVHGNVWEWCDDLWQQRRDMPEERSDTDSRVVRGGSWFHHPSVTRAADRSRRLSGYSDQLRGFRFALRSPGVPGR